MHPLPGGLVGRHRQQRQEADRLHRLVELQVLDQAARLGDQDRGEGRARPQRLAHVQRGAGGHDHPLDLRGRGEHGERAEHLVGVGAAGPYGQHQFGARAPHRVGEHGGGVGHRLRGHAERGVADDSRCPRKRSTSMRSVPRKVTAARASGSPSARPQPGLDQLKNIRHAASIDSSVPGQAAPRRLRPAVCPFFVWNGQSGTRNASGG